MGYNKYNLIYIEQIMLKTPIKTMLELGNQVINIKDLNICERIGKKYFESKNIEHVSIDWNGLDGSLKIDLTKPFPKNLVDMFDLVTNMGTTEHVLNQYETFKNMHNTGKIGCYYVNSVPLDTVQNKQLYNKPTKPHGIFEYNTDFFIKLCELCNYKIITVNSDIATWVDNHLCNAVYQKGDNSVFINKIEFNILVKKYTKYYPNGSSA
jgi:hypothetical protein